MSSKFQQILDNILRDNSPPKKISICWKNDAEKFYANPNHPTDKKLKCKYFLKGYCDKKDNCLYEHVKVSSKFKTVLCDQYQKGNCRFGDRCNYAHGQKELQR